MEFIATDRRRLQRKAERRRRREIVEVKEEKRRREKNVITYAYNVVRKKTATIVIITLHLLKLNSRIVNKKTYYRLHSCKKINVINPTCQKIKKSFFCILKNSLCLKRILHFQQNSPQPYCRDSTRPVCLLHKHSYPWRCKGYREAQERGTCLCTYCPCLQ